MAIRKAGDVVVPELPRPVPLDRGGGEEGSGVSPPPPDTAGGWIPGGTGPKAPLPLDFETTDPGRKGTVEIDPGALLIPVAGTSPQEVPGAPDAPSGPIEVPTLPLADGTGAAEAPHAGPLLPVFEPSSLDAPQAAAPPSTPVLLERFDQHTLPKASPEWIANGPSRFGWSQNTVTLTRQGWKAGVPQDVPKALAQEALKLFSQGAQRRPALLGAARRSLSSEPKRELVFESPKHSNPRLKEWVRFVPPTQPALPPTKAIVLLEVDGQKSGAMEMERGEEELKARLPEQQLSGLSAEDLNRLWTDPKVTSSVRPDQYTGRWEGRPLLSDVTLPHPVGFVQHAWKEGAEGVVGTTLLRPREHHTVMRIKAGAAAIWCELKPKGLIQSVRGLKGKPELMLCRLSFAIADGAGAALPAASKLYIELMGEAARDALKAVPDFMTRREPDAVTWLDFYYVVERQGLEPDATEKDLFEREKMLGPSKPKPAKPKIHRRG